MNPYNQNADNYMTDEDLQYFKQELLRKKRELLNHDENTKAMLQNYSNANEINDILMHSHERDKMLREIDDALQRIEQGTYGYCEETGDEIGMGRLKVEPTARYCIDVQEIFDKKKRFMQNDDDE